MADKYTYLTPIERLNLEYADRVRGTENAEDPYHDPDNDCPTNVAHRGMRSEGKGSGVYVLVCVECGEGIRTARPLRSYLQYAES